MLQIFYQSAVTSAAFFAAICWGSSPRASDTKKLNKLIKMAGFVLGTALEHLELNTLHPLYNILIREQSVVSWRLLQLCCSKDPYRKSFLPTAVVLYNNSPLRKERWLIFWWTLHIQLYFSKGLCTFNRNLHCESSLTLTAISLRGSRKSSIYPSSPKHW